MVWHFFCVVFRKYEQHLPFLQPPETAYFILRGTLYLFLDVVGQIVEKIQYRQLFEFSDVHHIVAQTVCLGIGLVGVLYPES